MKILVLSNTVWSLNNSFGNTFTNLFKGMKDVEIANICCRYGKPDGMTLKSCFQITEKSIIKNRVQKRTSSKQKKNQNFQGLNGFDKKTFDFLRKHNFIIFYWIRELIWYLGQWKTKELKNFIDTFDPDILFVPVYNSIYLTNIAIFLKKYTKKPMVCYMTDDHYSLHQFSLSPLYWIDRFLKRNKIRKLVKICQKIYVISELQKKEYQKSFKRNCSILKKGADFRHPSYKSVNLPIKLVYTGNLGNGRWKSLAYIGKCLHKINQNVVVGQLYIYSATPLSAKMKRALNFKDAIFFMGEVSAKEIPSIHEDADILVFVESMQLKHRLEVRQSFSTKIPDYFHASRCILAVGSPKVASIKYLEKHDAALIATKKSEIRSLLNDLVANPNIIEKYSYRSWNCGRINHQMHVIQNKLYNDLKDVIDCK